MSPWQKGERARLKTAPFSVRFIWVAATSRSRLRQDRRQKRRAKKRRPLASWGLVLYWQLCRRFHRLPGWAVRTRGPARSGRTAGAGQPDWADGLDENVRALKLEQSLTSGRRQAIANSANRMINCAINHLKRSYQRNSRMIKVKNEQA